MVETETQHERKKGLDMKDGGEETERRSLEGVVVSLAGWVFFERGERMSCLRFVSDEERESGGGERAREEEGRSVRAFRPR